MPPRRSCFWLASAGFLVATCTSLGQSVGEPASAKGCGSSTGGQLWIALREEAKRYANDSVALLGAPLSWSNQDATKAAGIGLTIVGLILLDQELDETGQQIRSGFTDEVSSATTRFGGRDSVYFSAGLLVAGLAFRDPETRDMGREALEASVLTHLLTKYALKPAFGRKRPEDSGGENVFRPFSHHSSFPSAHATQAFAVASVIARRSKGWVVPVLVYGAATVVALDRVNDRAHFASDVAAGAALGTAIGRFLVDRHRRSEQGEERSRVSLEMVAIPGGVGLEIRF